MKKKKNPKFNIKAYPNWPKDQILFVPTSLPHDMTYSEAIDYLAKHSIKIIGLNNESDNDEENS
jgi:hypothetical protein